MPCVPRSISLSHASLNIRLSVTTRAFARGTHHILSQLLFEEAIIYPGYRAI